MIVITDLGNIIIIIIKKKEFVQFKIETDRERGLSVKL